MSYDMLAIKKERNYIVLRSFILVYDYLKP